MADRPKNRGRGLEEPYGLAVPVKKAYSPKKKKRIGRHCGVLPVEEKYPCCQNGGIH